MAADIIGRINSRGGVEMIDYMSIPLSVRRKVEAVIKSAAEAEITLTVDNFQVEGDDIYLDGMDPADWLYAMTMD